MGHAPRIGLKGGQLRKGRAAQEKCTEDSDEEKLFWSIRDRIAFNLLLNDVVDAFNQDEISIDTSDVLEVQIAKKIFNEVVIEEPQLNF